MKGIMFTELLFPLVLDGSKTQTRRIIKITDCQESHKDYIGADWQDKPMELVFRDNGAYCALCGNGVGPKNKYNGVPPLYKVGSKVYLKEPWQYEGEQGYSADPQRFIYKFDYPDCVSSFLDPASIPGKKDIQWKNKMFMPAKASRYSIEILNVRVERLQDISEEDCLKEGIIFGGRFYTNGLIVKSGYGKGCLRTYKSPIDAYADLINSIDGKGTWEINPFVWVYDFELLTK